MVGRCRSGLRRRRSRSSRELRMIAVIPRFPDQDGRLSLPPNLYGREGRPAHARGCGRAPVRGLQPGERQRDTRSTCTQRCAWSTTPGPAWAPTTPTCGHGPTTASSAAPCWTAPSTTPPRGRAGCGCSSPTSTWVARRARTSCRTRLPLLTPSRLRRHGWTSGTRPGAQGPARPGSYGATSSRCSRQPRAFGHGPMYRLLYDPDGRSRGRRRSHSF